MGASYIQSAFPSAIRKCGKESAALARYHSRLTDASFRSTEVVVINLGPFSFLKYTLGIYRFPPGQPLEAALQGELLRELHRDYPTLTQIPGGAMFTDPPKGRVLIVDPTKIELTAMNAPNVGAAIDRMHEDLRKIVPLLHVLPPFRIKVEGAGTIQALEGLDPVNALKAYAPPRETWSDLAGRCAFAGLRYVFAADDGAQRDIHIEPLFAQPDKFFITIGAAAGSQGCASLDEAIATARHEAEVIERLSDRVVHDIAVA